MTFRSLLLAPILALCLSGAPTSVRAALTANAVVNADSFQIVDETNATADLTIAFGMRLGKELTYQRSNARFAFNDSLYVAGSLSVHGPLSGSGMNVDGGTGSGKITLNGAQGGKICVLDTDSVGYTVITADVGSMNTRAATGNECQ